MLDTCSIHSKKSTALKGLFEGINSKTEPKEIEKLFIEMKKQNESRFSGALLCFDYFRDEIKKSIEDAFRK